MRKTALAIAAIACLPTTLAFADDAIAVYRYELHLPAGRAGDADSFGRFLSAPRRMSEMQNDLSALGARHGTLGKGVMAKVDGDRSTASFSGDTRGFVRDVAVSVSRDGARSTSVVPDTVSSGDVLTLDRKGGDAFAYRLGSSWVRGFDVRSFTGSDGTTQRVQRPHRDEADLSGTVDLPVDRAAAVVEAGPDSDSGRVVVIFVAWRQGPCDDACLKAKTADMDTTDWHPDGS